MNTNKYLSCHQQTNKHCVFTADLGLHHNHGSVIPLELHPFFHCTKAGKAPVICALLVKLAGFPSVDLQVAVVVKVPVVLRLDMFLGGCHPKKNARSKGESVGKNQGKPNMGSSKSLFFDGATWKIHSSKGNVMWPQQNQVVVFLFGRTQTQGWHLCWNYKMVENSCFWRNFCTFFSFFFFSGFVSRFGDWSHS